MSNVTNETLNVLVRLKYYPPGGTFERETFKARIMSGQAGIWVYYFRLRKKEPQPTQSNFSELKPIDIGKGELSF
jgi:hypothetical protein